MPLELAATVYERCGCHETSWRPGHARGPLTRTPPTTATLSKGASTETACIAKCTPSTSSTRRIFRPSGDHVATQRPRRSTTRESEPSGRSTINPQETLVQAPSAVRFRGPSHCRATRSPVGETTVSPCRKSLLRGSPTRARRRQPSSPRTTTFPEARYASRVPSAGQRTHGGAPLPGTCSLTLRATVGPEGVMRTTVIDSLPDVLVANANIVPSGENAGQTFHVLPLPRPATRTGSSPARTTNTSLPPRYSVRCETVEYAIQSPFLATCESRLVASAVPMAAAATTSARSPISAVRLCIDRASIPHSNLRTQPRASREER